MSLFNLPCRDKALWLFALVSLIFAGPSFAAEEDKSHNACASALVTAFPDKTTYRLALGFFEGRGAGDASTGGPLADFLEEHFSRVPHVESAIACLRGDSHEPTVRNAIRFWNVVGMFPWPNNGGPRPIVALSRDGFPVILLSRRAFANPGLNAPWLTDVALSNIHEELPEDAIQSVRRSRTQPHNPYPRLHTLHLALTGEDRVPRELVAPNEAVELVAEATKLRELHIAYSFLWPSTTYFLPRQPQNRINRFPRTLTTLKVSLTASEEHLSPNERAIVANYRSGQLAVLWNFLPHLESLDLRGVLLAPIAIMNAPTTLTVVKIGPFLRPREVPESGVSDSLGWETGWKRLKDVREVTLVDVWEDTLPLLPAKLNSLTVVNGRFDLGRSALKRFAELSELDITDVSLDSEALARQLPTSLTALNLSRIRSARPERNQAASSRLRQRLTALTRLQRVSLRNTPFDSTVLTTLSPWVKELLLDTSDSELDTHLLAYLRRAQALQSLYVSWANTGDFTFLSGLPATLISLTLKHLSKADGLTRELAEGLQRAAYLQSLEIRHVQTDDTIFAYFPRTLRYVTLGRLTQAAPSYSLSALLDRCDGLQEFILADQYRTEEDFANLPASLVALETPEALSDAFLSQYLPRATELRYVTTNGDTPPAPTPGHRLNRPPRLIDN